MRWDLMPVRTHLKKPLRRGVSCGDLQVPEGDAKLTLMKEELQKY